MENLVIGIVLFNPELKRLKENLDNIYKKEYPIILVDNGSKNISDIEQFLSAYDGVKLEKNNTNLGIARALNQLTEIADKMHKQWIITLDQDSVCPHNMIDEYGKMLRKTRIGIICPRICDRNYRLEYGFENFENWVEIAQCITSASMVNINAWKAVNGYDESMFIDGVDFDFCRRIVKAGYHIYRTNLVCLLHEIGHIKVRKFLGFDVIVKNHSTFRKYYIARNTIYLERKSGKIISIIKSYFRVFKQMAIVLLYEEFKISKFKAMCKGMWDGTFMKVDDRWK